MQCSSEYFYKVERYIFRDRGVTNETLRCMISMTLHCMITMTRPCYISRKLGLMAQQTIALANCDCVQPLRTAFDEPISGRFETHSHVCFTAIALDGMR